MRLLTCSIATLLVLSFPADLAVGASGPQPFELVRELQVFQDQAAQKTNNARAEQKARVSDVAAELSKFDASVWTEPRNARAAVIYVLSGGDPSVLRKLVKSGAALAIDDRLAKGALAYGERHDAEAIELLDPIDVDALDRGIGGHVALVRALLVAKSDQRKAFALLDKARILSPGTIVEESALRRQAIMAAKMGDLDAFESLSSQYFRRFPTSIFAGNFEQQFGHEVVLRGYIANPKRIANLESLLRGLPDTERRETCLAIAEQAIATANVAAVRFAAQIAAIDARATPLDAIRMRLFEAAAVILTADYEEGSQALWTIDRSKLGVREEALLDAALSVAREIARVPSLPLQGAPSEAEMGADPADAGSRAISDAEQAIGRVDGLLSETSR
jgi:chemotaxis protein MotC